MDDLTGRTLGPYKLVELLGTGGMGAVYRGVHQILELSRAIKVMAPPMHLAGRDSFIRLFQREARLAARLRHPNIVQIFDVAQHDSIHYIVMELLEGRAFSTLIRQEGPLPLARATHLLQQLASALDYAHARGVIHRDLKPANAFVGENDHVTLMDFGIARASDDTHLSITAGAGTYAYMAPEVFDEGLLVDEAPTPVSGASADLYALGIVAFELLTGVAPFRGTNRQLMHAHLHRTPPSPQTLRPELPDDVSRVILRQLAKQPSERFASTGEFVEELARAAGLVPELAAADQAGGPSPASNGTSSGLPPVFTLPQASDSLVISPLASLAPTDSPAVPAGQASPATEVADAGIAGSRNGQRTDTGGPTTDGTTPARSVLEPTSAIPSPPSPAKRPAMRPPLTTPLPRVHQPGSSPSRQSAAVFRSHTSPIILGVLVVGAILAGLTLLLMQLLPSSTPEVAPRRTPQQTSAPTGLAPATPPIIAATSAPTPAPTAPAAVPTPPSPPSTSTTTPSIPTPGPAQRLDAALALLEAGEPQRALAQLEELRVVTPPPPGLNEALVRAYVAYGEVLLARSEWDASYNLFGEALKIAPGDATARNGQREAVLRRAWDVMEAKWGKDDDGAIAALEEIMRIDPSYRESRDKLYSLLIAKADRLVAANDRDGAFAALVRAIEVEPGRPEARIRLLPYTPTVTPLPTRAPAPPPTVVAPRAQPAATPPAQTAPAQAAPAQSAPPAATAPPRAPTATKAPFATPVGR